MVLVGSKPSFQTGGAKAPPCQPALLHFLNSNGKKFPSKFLDGRREFSVSLHCFAAHAGFGGDAFRCSWSLPILSFDLGVLICSGLIRDGPFSRIVEFPPQQRRCIRGEGAPSKLSAEFFANGDGVARNWKLGGHDATADMSTPVRMGLVLEESYQFLQDVCANSGLRVHAGISRDQECSAVQVFPHVPRVPHVGGKS